MWTGENDSNTLRLNAYFLKTEKISVFKKNPRIRVDRALLRTLRAVNLRSSRLGKSKVMISGCCMNKVRDLQRMHARDVAVMVLYNLT